MNAYFINGPFRGKNAIIAEDEPPPIIMMPVWVEGTTQTLNAVYERGEASIGGTGIMYYYSHTVQYRDGGWKEVDVPQYNSPVRICAKCGHKTVIHKMRKCAKCGVQSCPECDSRNDEGVCARCLGGYNNTPEIGKDENDGSAGSS